MIKGQVSIFEIIEPVKKVDVKKELPKVEVMDKQQKVIKAYKSAESTSRIVKGFSGDLRVEIKDNRGHKTLYFNKDGLMEFEYLKKVSVFPKDRILFYKDNFFINTIQQQRLQEVKEKYKEKIKRVIHRHGDENIFIELGDKLLDIIANGWVLEFKETLHVDCMEDEVLEDFTVKKDIGSLVKVGDQVKAKINGRIANGTITREYGLCNEILNISFVKEDGVRACTAIPRFTVEAILKAAI
ncbi:hypothetical protein [Clostridium felsineum]|uniref:hypothetical protein n=1 Tax=Clostridium felsineum TaxID=36839 RepID=UPI00098C5DCA|nr:hypothetical protein [Clostridium felsineum]URZ15311.1 hypothetical protein CLFE_013290 [Clostridium felsineum DSM 794]